MKISVSAKILSCALTLAVMIFSSSPARANVSSMYLDPSSQTIGLGDMFSLDIYLNNSSATVFDTVLADIAFDPSVFEVLDTDLSKPGAQIYTDPDSIYGFDFHIANYADNTTGRIDYEESFTSGGTTSGSGLLARIYFLNLSATPSSSISFNFNPTWGDSPTTAVLRGGADVLGASSTDHMDGTLGATVTVVPEPATFLLVGVGLVGLLNRKRHQK